VTETEDADVLVSECHSLGITRTSLVEVQDRQHVAAVPLSDIRRLSVRYGIASERTTSLAITGTGMLAISAWALLLVTQGLLAGDHPPKFEMLLVTLGPFGAVLLYLALRRRFYLRVETEKDVRKLPFATQLTHADLARFLDDLRPRLRCTIQNQLRNSWLISRD
jgi:hypothetical protein